MLKKKIRNKIASLIASFKPEIKNLALSDYSVKFREPDLDFSLPAMNTLRQTYVLIRKVIFDLEVKLNIMQTFKSLLKWNEMNLYYATAVRAYSLGFETNVQNFDYSDLNLPSQMKIREEIVEIMPYVRKVHYKKLYGVPFVKKPIYKSYFSREETRLIREKIAEQNKTGWANIEIFEIYDKFHYNLFSNIKQISGGKELQCSPNTSEIGKMPDKVYYLVIARKRDTNEPVKAIINPADIKTDN